MPGRRSGAARTGQSDNGPLVPRYQRVLEKGLPAQRRTRPKNVLVIGAGPAGLVAAWLLKRAGHRVTVLEANGNRAGGRVKTFRNGGHEHAKQPFADPRQYAEAGAMRIPGSHPLVMELIDQFGLKKRRFHYVDVDNEGRPRQPHLDPRQRYPHAARRLRPRAPAREPVLRRPQGPLGHPRRRHPALRAGPGARRVQLRQPRRQAGRQAAPGAAAGLGPRGAAVR
ncbi:flavin monoamine oxidase family protein [Streptomyces purpurascens]